MMPQGDATVTPPLPGQGRVIIGVDDLEQSFAILNGIPELRRVPILLLTVERTPQALRTGLDAGANDFVLKPIDAAKLLNRANRWSARGVPAG